MKPDPSMLLLFAAWRHAFAHGIAPALLHALWRRVGRYARLNAQCAWLYVAEITLSMMLPTRVIVHADGRVELAP